MIQKYTFGKPFETEAVVVEFPSEKGLPGVGKYLQKRVFLILIK